MASDPLYINASITIAAWELTEQLVLAGGPGGQPNGKRLAETKNPAW